MTRLRIATWNMHGGVGVDGRFAPDRIARVIGELDADVIALQEFGSRAAFDMHAHLQAAGGHVALVMPTFVKRGSDFGNAVLTRLPVESSARHDLALDLREPRNAVEVVVGHPGGRLRVIATHLGLQAGERREQIARLRSVLAVGAGVPTVLLGDFNTWRGSGLRELDLHFGPARAPATFPAPFPVAALDRIWTFPGSACVEVRAHRSRSARAASDHLPLVATLELR